MVSDWDLVKIEDIGDVKSGKRLPKDHSLICDETPFPYIRLVDVSDGRIRRDNLQYLTEATKEKIQKYVVNTSDVCLAIVGHTIGMVFYVDSEWDNNNLTENAARITNIREDIVSRYLYYFLISPQGQTEILSRKVGSAQGKLPLYNIKSLEVLLPPLPEQKAIAHILGSLDDKIELNRQMNETLEAMAQALFKSWFVDFDPVIDNALAAGNAIPDEFSERAEQRKAIEKKDNSDIQALFPDEFEFTEEMGWIPKGWESGTIADISFVKGGYAFKSKDFIDTGFPVIKIKNINSDRTVNTSDLQFIPNEIAKKAENFWLKTGDLMMAMTGATVGKFGLLVAENKKVYLLNQRVAKFSPISSVSDKIWFIYCFLNQKSTIDYIVNIAEGSAQPNISADSIMATQLVKPSDELINIFNETVDSNFNKMLMNREECLTLERLRDTLLPKLMSGELRIADAAELVNKAI
ncbi:restriction endonuclease subunit S [Psychrobacter sp. AOP7-D1-15]|uniref:restriction endonuclease subunit S n=1 Tax=unclassified Psychrobacter TaxID=196806 RepID=UPI0018684605|nr:restriction endonuclease subunit S [Psychrobacter sp. FME61]